MLYYKTMGFAKPAATVRAVCTILCLLCGVGYSTEITLTSAESNLVTEAVAHFVVDLTTSNSVEFAASRLPSEEFGPYIHPEIAGNASIVSNLYSDYVAFCTLAFEGLAQRLSLPQDTSVVLWESTSVQSIAVTNAMGKTVLDTTVVVSNSVGQASFSIADMSIVGTNLWIRRVE